MVYVTGDCHGEFGRFSTDRFPVQKEMTRDDVVIVCGDFGIWDNGPSERWWLGWLSEKPFTVAFVDGNHENFDRLDGVSKGIPEFETVEKWGAPVQRIRENIFHLLRGEIYTIDGKKFFTFGGAQSHDIKDGILDMDDFSSREEFLKTVKLYYSEDKWFRINHVSWWSHELPTPVEIAHGNETLNKAEWSVDFVITHCAPVSVAAQLGYHDDDLLTQWFEKITGGLQFREWLFGHYHTKRRLGRFTALYESIIRIV